LFFFITLSDKIGKDIVDEAIFIARSPVSFEYVLEFLTYEKLISKNIGQDILQLLLIDSDYYILPDLKKEVEEKIKDQQSSQSSVVGIGYAKLLGPSTSGSGSYWNWTIDFQENLDLKVENNNIIRFSCPGTYQIMVSLTHYSSSNGQYSAIYHNSKDVARCYHNDGNGYQNTYDLNSIIQISKLDTIQIYDQFNTGPLLNTQANRMTILQLSKAD
jgi:hypothetical protein